MRKDESYILRMSDYVKRNLKKGYKRDAVRFALISQGNSKIEVDKALNFAEKELAQEELRAMPKKVEPTFIMPTVEPEKEPFWKRLFG